MSCEKCPASNRMFQQEIPDVPSVCYPIEGGVNFIPLPKDPDASQVQNTIQDISSQNPLTK